MYRCFIDMFQNNVYHKYPYSRTSAKQSLTRLLKSLFHDLPPLGHGGPSCRSRTEFWID